MHHELVIELKQLPEDDVELLSEEDLLDGVRELGAPQRIAQQSHQTLRYELQVLGKERDKKCEMGAKRGKVKRRRAK